MMAEHSESSRSAAICLPNPWPASILLHHHRHHSFCWLDDDDESLFRFSNPPTTTTTQRSPSRMATFDTEMMCAQDAMAAAVPCVSINQWTGIKSIESASVEKLPSTFALLDCVKPICSSGCAVDATSPSKVERI